jgi:mannitol-specific phosphotransferase system IIBC component
VVSVVNTIDGGVRQLISMRNGATGHQIIVIVRTPPTPGVSILIQQVCGNN